MFPPARDRYFDPVQLVQIGSVTAGLEGAVAASSGPLLIWGWLSDPDNHVRRLSCVLGGEVEPVELIDRLPRPDIVEIHAGVVRSRDPLLGVLGLVQASDDRIRAANGRIALQVETVEGSGSSTNRVIFEPGSSFRELAGGRLPVALMRPEAIRRAAQGLLWPEAARVLTEARRGLQTRTYGGSRTAAALSVAVPVLGDGSGLRELLAYLDMSRDRDTMEVVIALGSDRHAAAVHKAVRDAQAGFPVTVLQTAEALGAGGAARLALEACGAPAVVLMSETVVPPSDLSAAEVVDAPDARGLAAPAAMPRFDGPDHRVRPLIGVSEESFRTGPETSGAEPSITDLHGWSPELLAGRRDALLALDVPWSAPLTAEGFWALLLAKAVSAGAAPWPTGARFTYVPPPGGTPAEPEAWRLLDGHGLADLLAASSGRPAERVFQPIVAA